MIREIERGVWIAGLAAQALILFRLNALNLLRRYPVFSTWLAFALLRAAVLFPFSPNEKTYLTVWMVTRPVGWVLTILAVSEITSAAFSDFRGISSLIRKFNWIAAAAALAIATLTVSSVWGEPSHLYRVFFRIGQGVHLSATFFLAMFMILLRFFPMPISRNLSRHATLFALFMILPAMVMLFENLSPTLVTQQASLVNQAIGALLLISWAFIWSAEGESKERSSPVEPGREQTLLDHLAAINAALARPTPRKPSV